MKYLHRFLTTEEYKKEKFGDNYIEPWVSLTVETHATKYNKKREEERQYLTTIPFSFEILSDGYLNFQSTTGTSVVTKTIEYSKDSGTTWTSVTSSTGGTHIDVISGETIQFRGYNTTYEGTKFVGGTAKFNLFGNIMSLIDGDNFVNLTEFTENNVFNYFFRDCYSIVNAYDLILPATTLTPYCYSNMFYYCTSLTKAPELLATTMVSNCYSGMFSRCTALLETPELPATTLADSCYREMFYNCTKITKLPKLSVLELAPNCYMGMFNTCTSLTTVTNSDLPATTLASGCYRGMFGGCSNLTTIPQKLIYDIMPTQCFYGMFSSCKKITEMPIISSNSFGDSCCANMFDECTNLTGFKSITGEIKSNGCFKECFKNCTSLTDLSNYSLPTIKTGNNSIYSGVFNGCTNLTHSPNIEITVGSISSACFYNAFKNCSKLQNVINLPSTGVAQSAYVSMYQNCASITTPPIISATTVSEGGSAMAYMFAGCTSLEYVPEIKIKDAICDAAFKYMFSGCTTITSVTNNYLEVLDGPEACYGMFAGCTNLVKAEGFNFICNTLKGCKSMFEGCTKLEIVPRLKSNWLVSGCYERMFYGCSSLSSITADFLEEPTDEYTKDWVVGVSETGDFYKNKENTWDKFGTNAIPQTWNVHTRYGIRTDYDYIVIKNEGDEFKIRVESNDSWTIQNIPSWITFSVTTGNSGTTIVNGTVNQNTTNDYREANISFKVNNGDVNAECVIIQDDNVDYEQLPLTLEILSGGTLYWKLKESDKNRREIKYSINNNDVVSIISTTEGTPIVLQTGDKISFFGGGIFNSNGFSGDTNLVCCAYGNMKSMAGGTDWTTDTLIDGNQVVFKKFFYGFSSLVTYKTKKLHLWGSTSSTNRGANAYFESCFENCTNIVNGKNFVIHGEYVGYTGYINMFKSCTNLKTLPVLDKLKSSDYGYHNMFAYCKSIRNINGFSIDVVPERQGYYGMFSHCYGLRYAKIVFNAERLVSQQCGSMFAYCINLLEGPEAIPDIVAGLACSSMFKSCKALVKAPELPALTTNIDRCYVTMFKDCNKLNEIKCNSTTGNNAQTSTHYWTANVAPTGIFYKNPNTTWIKGVSGVPNGWTIIDIEN